MKTWLPKTIFFLSLFLLAYYLLAIHPQRLKTNYLFNTQTALTSLNTPLLQNHLALTQIPRLNPNNPEFEAQQDRLLTQLDSTRQEALTALQKPILTNNEYLTPLLQDAQSLLEYQPQLIDNYQPDSPEITIFTTKQAQLIFQLNQYQKDIKDNLQELTSN